MIQECEEKGTDEGGEEEPEECCAGLEFVAAFCGVVGAVC